MCHVADANLGCRRYRKTALKIGKYFVLNKFWPPETTERIRYDLGGGECVGEATGDADAVVGGGDGLVGQLAVRGKRADAHARVEGADCRPRLSSPPPRTLRWNIKPKIGRTDNCSALGVLRFEVQSTIGLSNV